jgi:hypothetical protein
MRRSWPNSKPSSPDELIDTQEARLEITEAGGYYRRISKGLALGFKQRLTAALEDICRNPAA